MAITGRPVGRPPKPVSKKIAEGNRGHRHLPKASLFNEEIDIIPAPPDDFSQVEVSIWNNIWNAGKAWFNTARDYYIIVLLVRELQEYNYLRISLKLGSAAGGVDRVTYTDKGYPVQHPYVSMKDKSQQKINTYISSLGLSPTDSARLQLNNTEDEDIAKISELLGGNRRGE